MHTIDSVNLHIWFLLFQITIKSVSKTGEFIKTLPQNIVPKDYGGLAPKMSETNGKFTINFTRLQHLF